MEFLFFLEYASLTLLRPTTLTTMQNRQKEKDKDKSEESKGGKKYDE
jgi:hypothetical protein